MGGYLHIGEPNGFWLKDPYLSSSCSEIFVNFERRFSYSDYAPSNI